MANNFKYTRLISDSIKVRGIVNIENDSTYIVYEKDGDEYSVNVVDLFKQFSGETVNVAISTKEETDLDA